MKKIWKFIIFSAIVASLGYLLFYYLEHPASLNEEKKLFCSHVNNNVSAERWMASNWMFSAGYSDCVKSSTKTHLFEIGTLTLVIFSAVWVYFYYPEGEE